MTRKRKLSIFESLHKLLKESEKNLDVFLNFKPKVHLYAISRHC